MKKKGSITIMLALMITCVFSGIFALLEAGRVCGLKANTVLSTEQVRDGILASYQRELWENYHLLFWEEPEESIETLDAACTLQQELVEGNRADETLGANYYLLPIHLTQVEATSFQLATDCQGASFRAQAVYSMKNSVAESTLNRFLALMEDGEEQTDESELSTLETQAEASMDDVREQAAEAEQAAEDTEEAAETVADEVATVDVEENPIDWMKDMRQNGVLGLVVTDGEISDKEIDLSDSLNDRSLHTGTYSDNSSESLTDKAIFRFYLSQYFGSYGAYKGDRSLDYELEYMLVGKESDRENLKGTVRRLLAMRTGVNLAYLETDLQKQEEALAVATTICSAFGAPELGPALEQGMLVAWAYAESISDVKILMNGEKVALVKTEDQWHTDLTHISSSVAEAGEVRQDRGLSYETYLHMLLWTTGEKKLTYRAMDLIEAETDLKMDCMVSRMDCSYKYQASPLFWRFVGIGDHSLSGFSWDRDQTIDFTSGNNSE